MIRFGIEQEGFLFRVDGCVPQRGDVERLFNALVTGGMRTHAVDGAGWVLGVAHLTAYGSVVIKSDFCSHILEVAYPPVRTGSQLEALMHDVEVTLGTSIASSGLRRYAGAALERIPDDTVIIPCNAESEQRIARLLARNTPSARFSHRMFDAAICATQVHLDVLDDAFYPLLPALYALEYLVPLLFANGTSFAGQRAYCVRPLVWRDCFAESYLAHGFPDPVPASATDYALFIDTTPGFIRDYTLVAPRPELGSAEFRGACAQDTPARMLELVALRLAAYAAARSGQVAPRVGARAHFYDVCETGRFDRAWAKEDLAALRGHYGALPDDLVRALQSVCERLERLLEGGADA